FDPSPNIFILEIGKFSGEFGIILLNILSKPDFLIFGACGFLIIFNPQNVKNIVTSFPIDFAPVAIIKEASALSKSPLKTTIVAPSFVSTSGCDVDCC